MLQLIVHPTPRAFLEQVEAELMHNEAEHNMVLGICYNLAATPAVPGHYFLQVVSQEGTQAFSIKTGPKTIVSGHNPEAIRLLAAFYQEHHIDLPGCIGHLSAGEVFSQYYGRPITRNRPLLVQALTQVNIPKPRDATTSGTLETATTEQAQLLTGWTLDFKKEEDFFPPASIIESVVQVNNLIGLKELFTWNHEGEPVCMSAIIRKTKNAAVIGLVYTPRGHRGKGYAKSCMQALSEHILAQGYTYSVLLVYVANAKAAHIYENLGYKTVATFTDMVYEN